MATLVPGKLWSEFSESPEKGIALRTLFKKKIIENPAIGEATLPRRDSDLNENELIKLQADILARRVETRLINIKENIDKEVIEEVVKDMEARAAALSAGEKGGGGRSSKKRRSSTKRRLSRKRRLSTKRRYSTKRRSSTKRNKKQTKRR